MESLKAGQVVTVQARSCKIGGLILLQDEILQIENVSNCSIDFLRLSDRQHYTAPKTALTLVVA